MTTSDPCFARLDGDLLTVGNDRCERRWRVIDGALHALSFRALGHEWLVPGDLASTVPTPRPAGRPSLTLARGARHAVEAPSLLAELVLGAHTYRFQVFPGVPAVTVQVSGPPAPTPTADAARADASGIEAEGGAAAADADADLLERFRFARHHAHLVAVALMDRTDLHDNLAQAAELRLSPKEDVRLRGCLFAVHDPLTGEGLVLLKHAPLPHARPAPCPFDCRARHRDISLHGHGAGDTGEGYPWTMLAYAGAAAGRTAALHALQRAFRPYVPGRDGRFLSNTWGDRNRDGRIGADFIAEEIAAGTRIGVDVVQIDDGWQRGISANSVHRDRGGVWQGFWASDERFWAPHPQRFPAGLADTAGQARARGLGLGLWFAPDSADHFANWERDAAAVLDLWRTHGVAHVKIDGVKATSKRGEGNLWRFFRRVLEASGGAVVFDLDVTAEVRPGYFGMMQSGPLFVENRYSDWGQWWPHATLRNLWQLAHWIDPNRLRIEFLNPRRNADRYGDDPLAPARHRATYGFATTLIANPLGWFESSALHPDDAAAIGALATVWRAHRDRLHGGAILPIGAPPDGASWTGFRSDDDGTVYVLAFRELAPSADWALPLPPGAWRGELLAGDGAIAIAGGALELRIPAPLGFLFVRAERVGRA